MLWLVCIVYLSWKKLLIIQTFGGLNLTEEKQNKYFFPLHTQIHLYACHGNPLLPLSSCQHCTAGPSVSGYKMMKDLVR